MKMTVELLHELGSCGDYTRVFRRRFPTSEYPDGVEVNEEVCGKHAADFSWSWAVDVMLNGDGADAWQKAYDELQQKYTALVNQHNQNLREWRERTGVHYPDGASQEEQENYRKLQEEHEARLAEDGFDTSYDVYNHMQARAFGRIFAQDPSFRSSKIVAAQERAVARVEQQIIDQHASVESDIAYTNRQIENLKAEIERLTARLPELEEREAELRIKVAPAKAKRAQAQAKLLAERAEEAAKRAQAAQEVAAKAQSDADALTAEAAEAVKTETDEAGSASTEVAAATS